MISRRTQRWAIPLGLAVLYVAVLAVTAGLSTHPTQPLFEGVGPTAPYRWANPPAEFAATNQPPGTLDTTVPMSAAGSAPISGASHDGQLVLNLGAGAIPPADGASSVHVLGTPLDPATLGPLPAPVRSDGNAYRVDVTYLPTNVAATTVAKPGNVVMIVPEAADAIYFSPDGKAWEKRQTQTVGGPSTVGTTFDKPGYYLAGTTAPLTASSTGGGSSWNSIAVVGVTALAGLVLVLVPALIWRSRTKASNAKQSRQVRRNAERKRSKKTKRR